MARERWQAPGVASLLAPSLLVAAPALRCEFFHHTVVLLVDHRDEGALGFVINRRANLRLADVLTHVGIPLEVKAAGDEPVMVGGPVSPETGWVVFDSFDDVDDGDDADGVLRVTDRLSVSANLDMLSRIARGRAPERHAMMLGYAGWGPGQLDDEIRQGSWIPVDVDANVLFETPIEARWAVALGKLGIDPARVVSTVVADA